MQTVKVKQEAHHLLEKLPDNATWDDLMYEIYVRQAIEAGLSDSKAGRTIDVKDVRAKFGLLIRSNRCFSRSAWCTVVATRAMSR